MTTFAKLGLHPDLQESLTKMGYDKPTPIQAQAIPLALEGRDVMGTAQTGTGKTAAFAIPLVQKLLDDPTSEALVLVPTRELGKQIMEVMKQLIGHQGKIKTAFIIGGEPMSKQMNQLKNRPRLIVGTPGRINDHLQRRSMDLENTNFLVLDETDRMLDMGFSVQLERIFKYMKRERQTLMFSATMPENILRMSSDFMNNPERIKIGHTNVVAQNIKTDVVRIDQAKKYDELLLQLHDRSGSVIIFIKTKHGADRMAKNLRRDGFTADALHGDLRQSKREKVMQNFRDDNFRILVATDIAARGLDVPSIQHVVNYDLPQVAEDYIHRMGRTARAGASGSALCFVSPADGRKWHAIECLLDPNKKTNERKYDKTKPRRRKSNAAGSKPGSRRDEGNKSYGKKDKPQRRERSDRDGDEKRDFKKPYKQKRHRGGSKEGENTFSKRRDNRDEGKDFKKPYKKKRPNNDNTNDGESRSDKPYKKSFKKPYSSKNNDEKSDNPYSNKPRSSKPKFDKKRGDNPHAKKAPAGFAAKGGAFKSKGVKKKNTNKTNAKKSNF